MEDLSILQAFRRNDISGCTMAYKKYYKPLCMYAYAFLQDNAKAEDAVQDAFVALCIKKDLWPNIVDIRSYLFKTVSNRCKSIIKARSVSERSETEYSNIHADKSCGIELPVENTSEIQDKIQKAVSSLSPKRRKVISMVYFEGISYLEAAARMGVSKNTIKTHLLLGRSELKGSIKLVYFIPILSFLF
ncbi:RNA polymerase sigma factor [Chitinophaga rhizosphaerae]|uniref:RNA polymerase sigma factor n=1 Tax=Chitinophaga rhizosphaerae TaxID=1864947 RepID=UPI0013E09251|nr:sigma-70 family RNA polymerase sigma factor [Chitinophaga rhizosphaerae]